MSEECVVVLVTCGSREEASHIAATIVEDKLAACANILPGITSVYRWQGKIERETEVLLLIKTTKKRLLDLEARVKDAHSYDVPEFVALPIVAGSSDYLNWIAENVR